MPREEFSKKVRDNAAKKVGYLCSCPSCKRITVGSKIDHSETPSSIGESAHIYPASKGGKRYDSTIPESEISKESNCIWLCSYHHTLIDTDVVKFSAKTLKEWKENAENFANSQLEKSTIAFKNLSAKAIDVELIDEVLFNYLKEGKIIDLLYLIRKLENSTHETEYYQLYAYYEEVIYFYNNKELFKQTIGQFIQTAHTNYVNRMVNFLLENCEFELIQKYSKFVPAELDTVKELINEENKIGYLISHAKKLKLSSIILSKTLSNLIYNDYMTLQNDINNPFSSNGTLYDGEFIYKLKTRVYTLSRFINADLARLKEIITNNIYIWLISVMDNLKEFDFSIQLFYWRFILAVSSYEFIKKNLLANIPQEILDIPLVKISLLNFEINGQIQNTDFLHLLQLSSEAKNYNLLLQYLSEMILLDRSFVEHFIIENSLIHVQVDFLFLWVLSVQFNIDTQNLKIIKDSYGSTYNNELIYHLILAKIHFLLNDISYQEEISLTIKMFTDGYPLPTLVTINFVIDIFVETQQYEFLKKLYSVFQMLDYKILIIESLIQNSAVENVDFAINELNQFYLSGIKNKRVFLLLGTYYYNLKQYYDALKYYKEAHETFTDDETAYYYFSCILNSGDTLSTEQSKQCLASSNLNLIKVSIQDCISKKNFDDARSKLLYYFSKQGGYEIDLNKQFFGLLNFRKNVETSRIVKPGFTCRLESEKNSFDISIHKFGTVNYPSKQFFGCYHYNDDAQEISAILHRYIGSEVEFNGNSYIIKSVLENENNYFHYLLGQMLIKKDALSFEFDPSNPELGFQKIFAMAEGKHNYTDRIMSLYDSTCNLPISFLSNLLDQRLMDTLEYLLYLSKTKIENNSKVFKVKKVIISYDCLIQLFRVASISASSAVEYFITQSTKDIMLRDIELSIIDYLNPNRFGNMSIINGKPVYREVTEEQIGKRLVYLNEFKSFVKKTNVAVFKNIHLDIDLLNVPEIQGYSLDLEVDIFSALKSDDELTLLTDDKFLSAECDRNGIKYIGITGLLFNIANNFSEVSKSNLTLKETNYSDLIESESIYDELRTKINL